ncbi:hypothetical protein M885DRAFT_509214, partial [Pelagophyceae sp. CCMP2097]
GHRHSKDADARQTRTQRRRRRGADADAPIFLQKRSGADGDDPQSHTWCRCGLCVRELPYGAAAVGRLVQVVHLAGRAESHWFVGELLFGVAAIPIVSSSVIESLTEAFISTQTSPAQPAVVRESVRYLERDHLHAIEAVVRLADERLRRRCGAPGPPGSQEGPRERVREGRGSNFEYVVMLPGNFYEPPIL